MYYPIDVGTSELVDVDQEVTRGYVFVEAGPNGLTETVQRWVLYPGYVRPPARANLLKLPTNTSRRFTTLSGWSDALLDGDLWIPNSKYVKVNCRTYSTINYAPPHCPNEQIDDGTYKLKVGATTVGFGQAVGIRQTSYEHWVLYGGYSAPPSSTLVIGPPSGTEASPTLADFIAQMSANWSTQWTYAICACTEYKELPAEL